MTNILCFMLVFLNTYPDYFLPLGTNKTASLLSNNMPSSLRDVATGSRVPCRLRERREGLESVREGRNLVLPPC